MLFRSPLTPPAVTLRANRVNEVLGTDLNAGQIGDILTGLGCGVAGADDLLTVTVPSFRPDLRREADLVEEVARIYGYDRIESRGVRAWNVTIRRSPEERLRDRLRTLLTGLGLTEVATNTMIDERWVPACGISAALVRVANPISAEAGVLRPSLLPSLLNVARWNLNRKVARIPIFEVGKVFRQGEGAPEERVEISGLLVGPRRETFWEEGEADFYDAKGILEGLFEHLTARPMTTPPAPSALYEPGPSAEVRLGGEVVGSVGQVRRSIAEAFDIRGRVFAFSLDFQSLLPCADEARTFQALPRFPAVERDFALLVGEEVPAERMISAMREAGGALLETVEVFDLYRGEKIPPGHKSLAFALRFRAPDRTLSEEEVDRLRQGLVKQLRETCGAELRTS